MYTCIYHLPVRLVLLIGHMPRADHLRLYKPYRTLILEDTESPSSSHWTAPPACYLVHAFLNTHTQPFRRYAHYFHIYIASIHNFLWFEVKDSVYMTVLHAVPTPVLCMSLQNKWMKLTYDYICIHICIIYVKFIYRSCMYCYTLFPERK